MGEFADALNGLLAGLMIYMIVAPIIAIVILVFVVRTIIKYAAKENAKAFHYDELARKIASEIIRTQINYAKIQQQQFPGANMHPDNAASVNQPANQQGNATPEPRRYRPPGL